MVQAPKGLGQEHRQIDQQWVEWGWGGGGGGEQVCADAVVFEGGCGNKLRRMKRDNSAPRVLEMFSKRIKSRCGSEQLK